MDFASYLVVAITLYVVCFASLTYICIIADPRKNPVANLIMHKAPNKFADGVKWLMGETIKGKLDSFTHYCANEPHPFMQVVYCFIVFGGWTVMFHYGFTLVPNTYVGGYHKYNGYVVFLLCISSYVTVVKASPGTITAMTLTKYDNYDYDKIMFHPGQTCPTVGIRKLARSKYDRMTRRHVPRFDHYCGWLNNTIGEENYRLFIWFLIVHTGMLWYGVVLTVLIFKSEAATLNLKYAAFYDNRGRPLRTSYVIVVQYLIQEHNMLAALLLLMFVMALIVSGFLCFHIYLISRGMTTNEFYKWNEIQKRHKILRMDYAKAVAEGRVTVTPTKTSDKSIESDTGSDSLHHSEDTDGVLVDIPDADVGCTGAVVVNNDGTDNSEIDEDATQTDPGILPTRSHYNLGLIANIQEVFFPRCFRPEAQKRYSEFIQAQKSK
uniref:Palmitoyltransferase n=1 Tax=Leptocylindrus danicus TaxID=163516 RepID=A0A7S2PPS5_9STRA|mmetsp:Transcript_7488/g.11138  ORF Transcript_7488/g.11138 Transcript_7488/m.11138 type:complete len:436 (+) Transcript_7488:141-1448(+)|eukprot:CAMPEP_0116016956 /NCGR_PEP_ID=MMETSP0321-20121206/7774_1 /TAXON_ID=163516 /ORGANISM="Leptocylindrus danicus var. danicus, Strain B650" /LENGTH=435 /DNA_ID=CAMNT_0003487083 /DNA_START=65 /DNA_END=1372 /DNA_ORIENTATION=+